MAIVNQIDDGIFTITGLFTPLECENLIKRGEDLGYEAAGVRTSNGPKMITKIRNNDRAEFKDTAFADDIWARVEPYMPPVLDGVRATGLFPSFRFYRYDPGQRFKRHVDGAVDMPNGDRSKLTLLIYLTKATPAVTPFSAPTNLPMVSRQSTVDESRLKQDSSWCSATNSNTRARNLLTAANMSSAPMYFTNENRASPPPG